MSLLGLATDAFYQAAGSNPASYETDRSDLHMKVMRSPAKDVRKSMEEYLTTDSIVKVGKIPTNFDIFRRAIGGWRFTESAEKLS